MRTDKEHNTQGMPTDFEILELRRALHYGKDKTPNIDDAWKRLSTKIESATTNNFTSGETVGTSIQTNSTLKSHDWHSWQLRTVASAVAIAMIVILSYPLLKGAGNHKKEVIAAINDSRDVTLTTDGGTPHVVKGQFLKFNKHVPSNVQVRMMEVGNPRGKVCHIILSDGTKVWLNAESNISFPERFEGRTREVSLSGEAYFEVKKDAHRPFIVTTEKLTTTVHGTIFDVCAYPTNAPRVTLFEGSVAVRGENGTEQFIRPGQVASISETGDLSCSNCDTYPIAQWKDGFFYFDNSKLIDIMRELSRWYNVNVVFETELSMNLRLHFVAEHKESLATIISRLNEIGNAHITLKDDVVTIH